MNLEKMFCIDYLLSSSSRRRPTVALINAEEAALIGIKARVRRPRGSGSQRCSCGSAEPPKGPNENVSDLGRRTAVAPETSAQSQHGLSRGGNPLAVADCAVEHNPNKAVFTLNAYRHPSYELTFFAGALWIHCAQDQDEAECFLKQSLNGAILLEGCHGPAARHSKHWLLSSTCSRG